MKKIILSGGGTGGHIYPAVAVAEALKRRFGGDVELLFVGAEGKMEMEKVPALGYRIVGLPIAGLQRRMDWHNLAVPLKVLRSIRMAKKTIRDFGADAVVGFGGYASAPVLWAAHSGPGRSCRCRRYPENILFETPSARFLIFTPPPAVQVQPVP